MRLFFHIAYKGTNFNGWQRQPGGRGIQACIEDALSKIAKRKIIIIGCGRTDAGVHASQYFFHVSWRYKWSKDWVHYLNHQLPDDITIFDIIPIEEQCHAQHSVTERTYDFLLHFKRDAFISDYSTFYDYQNLDFKKMAIAVKLLEGDKEFGSFCLSPEQYPSTVCKVSSAKLFQANNGVQLRFQITADRFLQGMIRKTVSKLLAVGLRKLSLEEFKNQLRNPKETKDVKLAYPQGLFLSKVTYPFLNLESESMFSKALLSNKNWREIV